MTKIVTLLLDNSLLRKGRHLAVEEDKSFSQWVVDLIAGAVDRRENLHRARKHAVARMEKGFHLGGKPLTREEVHAR